MKTRLTAALVLVGLAYGPAFCFGEEKEDSKASQRSQSLESILKSEAKGEVVDRSKIDLHDQDASKTPDKALRWQAGEIEIEGQWQKLADLEKKPLPSLLQRYHAERGEAPLDVEGHRRMARWCASNKLPDQEKAHWHGVLEANPNDLETRQALGFRLVAGRWFAAEEINAAQLNAKDQIKSMKEWVVKIRDIVASLESKDTQKRLKGIQQLKAIKDPKAVKSLHFAATRTRADTALHLLNAIKRFQTKDACMALAFIAIHSPSTELGQEAASALRKFPKEMYVPALLDFMSTEKDLRRQLVTQPNGDLVLQLLEVRELKSHVETAQLDKVLKTNNASELFFGTPLGFANRGAVAPVAFAGDSIVAASENQVAASVTQNEATRDVEAQQARLNQENETTRQIQRNVCTVLRIATGVKLDDQPNQWWNWWDLDQEILTVGNKEILKNYDRDFQSLVYSVDPRNVRVFRSQDYPEEPSNPSPPQPSTGGGLQNRIRPSLALINPSSRRDCLVAGSMIQTANGLRPIESIQVGDRIVSQNIETGEISLKPVLQTTQRPPSITCNVILANGEKIQATLGHHWWIVGKGWVKTKDLQPGMRIRTASNSIEITKVEDAKELTTYNFLVADHHSYFVGKEGLLSHDSRELVPTFQVVPGMAAASMFQD